MKAPDVHTLNVKVGRTFAIGNARNLDLSANVFNLYNWRRLYGVPRTGPNRIYKSLRAI